MVKLSTLRGEDDYLQLPRLAADDVRVLWHVGYWDGPLSGVLSYHEEKYWFQMCAKAEESGEDLVVHNRRYLVVALTEEQLREEEDWHDLFRLKVGTHADYDANRHRRGTLQPREMWHEFYDAHQRRTPLDLSDNSVVGWFEW